MPDFLPRREAELLEWARNFDLRINAGAGDYSLTPEQAAEFRVLYEAFAAASQLASQPGTRTRPALAARDNSRAAMVRFARVLGGIVRAAAGVSDAQRIDLGLSARAGRASPVGPPTQPPRLAVMPILGRNAVRVWLQDAASPRRRAKPRGVAGATLLKCVAEQPPADTSRWSFAGSTTRTIVDVPLPRDVPPGAAVWVTAFWCSPTGRRGPAADPVVTRVAGAWPRAA